MAKWLGRAARAVRSRLAEAVPYERATVLGHKVTVRYGSLDGDPDYDDGWTLALIAESTRFFDVGCNVGFFSLLAALEADTREVVAVDANPRALAIAADNLLLNGFANRASFVCSFVSGSSAQRVQFFASGTGQASSADPSHARSASAHGQSVSVETTTLDDLSRRLGAPDFIKLDVEGAEYDALLGAAHILGEARTRFLVEMHAPSETTMAAHGTRVLGLASENAYAVYYLKAHTRVTEATPFAHRGRCHSYSNLRDGRIQIAFDFCRRQPVCSEQPPCSGSAAHT